MTEGNPGADRPRGEDRPYSVERKMIIGIRDGSISIEELTASTTELIAIFLAVPRFDQMPVTYVCTSELWDRLDNRQRDIVREFNSEFRDKQWDREWWQ